MSELGLGIKRNVVVAAQHRGRVGVDGEVVGSPVDVDHVVAVGFPHAGNDGLEEGDDGEGLGAGPECRDWGARRSRRSFVAGHGIEPWRLALAARRGSWAPVA